MAYITLLSSVLSFFLIAISADIQDLMVDKYNIDIQIIYPLLGSSDPLDSFDVTCYFVFETLLTRQKISMYTDNDGWRPEVSVIKNDIGVKLNFTSNFDINKTTGISTLYLKDKMGPGLYAMKIGFDRSFNSAFNEIYSDEKEVVWLSLTHFQPIKIQNIIPCWIKPKEDTSWLDMPTFNLSISHLAHYSVLTNMPIRKERLYEKDKLNMKQTYFDISPRMSPYQLSIVVTNFPRIIIDEDDVLSMWCRNRSASSLQFALTIARNITTYSYLNPSRGWLRWRFSARVNLIVIPKNQSPSTKIPERDSLVHPGIIIANEDDITYNEENDTVGRKYNVIRLLGYEIMREYYEWIVNPYWEPSTWLSKGFATFIAMHNLDQIWPNLRMKDLFVVQIQHECLDFDVDNSILPSHQQYKTIPVEIIDNMKGSVLLRMLQHVQIVSEVYWKAIDTFTYDSVLYKKKHHLKIFWRTLKDKIDLKIYDIEGWMHPWVEGKGYPVLTVKRNYDTSESTMELSVDFDFRKKRKIFPVSYTTRTNINFTQTSLEWHNFTAKNPKFSLGYREDSWVIFNVQQTGYYRVNYDDENWARISKYLNAKGHWKIHVLNRAQLIDDAFQFMLSNKLKADIFWQLTKYLERERDYIAWYPMFKALEYMSTSFHFYSQLRSILPKLTETLNTLFFNIYYEERPTDNDFTKSLRQEAAQWSCSFKLNDCKQMANVQLKHHLEIHTKLLPWWKKWTYCYGLIKADDITWHQTLNKIEENNNDKILYLVTCPNHLVNTNNYTSITYTNDNVISNINLNTIVQFQLRHFVYTIVESIKKDEEYNYEKEDYYKDNKNFKNLLDNFADIKPRQLKLSTALLIFLNNIYSIERLYDVGNTIIVYVIKGGWSTYEFKGYWYKLVSEGISESQIKEKLEARKNQLEILLSFFARIKPGN